MTILKSCTQSLQSSDMSWQFENSQNSEDSENLGSLRNIFKGVLGREKVEKHGDKEGENSKKVDNVEEGDKKLKLKLIEEIIFKFKWKTRLSHS